MEALIYMDAADSEVRTIISVDQPALSLSQQPSLSDLTMGIADPSRQITVICGAGVSKDSGLPNWRELIERLTDQIQPGLRDIVKLDPIDLPRKAEYIIALRRAHYQNLESLIAHGLYSGELNGGATPGVLADAIAGLIVEIPHRIRVMTTNYDNRLELALKRRLPGLDIIPRGLEESTKWGRSDRSRSVEVLHLHGYLAPEERTREPLILSESYYLKYGPKVRKQIQRALEQSLVLFVGMSLTDPNFIGPLHAATESEAYALMVPDTPEPVGTDPPGSLSLAYCAAQAQYRYKEFKVQTVILKSYGQVTQCINELTIAADPHSGYLDRSNGLHYGQRFRRIMNKVHVALRTTNGAEPASGSAGAAVSEALAEGLFDQGGPVAHIENFRSSNTPGYERLGLTEPHLDAESFALFLWVRERPDPRGEWTRYRVCLVGSSAFSHRSPTTLRRVARIEADSPVAAAKAVFLGKSVLDVVEQDDRGFRTWGTYQAVPLYLSECDLVPGASRYPVCVGAATLNTNYRYYTRESLEEAVRGNHASRMLRNASALSLMTRTDHERLATKVAAAARAAILSLGQ